MTKLKKIGLSLLGIVLFCSVNFSFALKLPYSNKTPDYTDNTNITASGDNVIADGSYTMSQPADGIIHTQTEITNHETALNHTLHLIQVAINWLLGILATVALIYMLYNGFLIFTSGSSDDGAKKGKKGITTAFIALAGIGLSWLIVSAILRFINMVGPSA